jgi:lipoate-protein ligase B
MVPCGLQNTSVVSMKSVLGREVPMDELKSRLIDEFCAVFNYERPDASLSAN